MTGGAGFLGSMLVAKLLSRGYGVRVLDNLLYGVEPVKPYILNQKFELFKGDVRDLNCVVRALHDVDVVVHLASIVGDQAGDLEPKTTIQINYLSTKNIAELCELYEKRLMYSSSCSVYGDSPRGVMHENIRMDRSINYPKPLSLYGETKLRSERAIQELTSDYVILRLGTLFGLSNRMRFDLALNLFIAQALKGDKITVFGGDQWRPFLHVQDAADCFVSAIENDWNGIFNCSWENLKIIDAVRILQKYLSVDFTISQDVVDRRNYRISCEKIRSMGFAPQKDIKYAIDEIKACFDKGDITDYKLPIYSNYKHLFTSEEVRRKAYVLGPIGETVKNNREQVP